MAYRFDIHVQALPAAEQVSTFKFMSFGYNPTVAVKGFQMLINQWLMLLLTPVGGDPTDPDRGTKFPGLAGSNLDVADARDVVVLAIDQCNDQIATLQRSDSTLTASERLASAELINFVEKPSDPGFEATVELKNQANERLRFNLPDFANAY